MRLALILPALALSACVAGQGADVSVEKTQVAPVLGFEGEPVPQGPVHLSPWPGPGPVDPAVIRLLPAGVGADDVLLGSNGCYYYQQDGRAAPVRYDADPTHFYCIG